MAWRRTGDKSLCELMMVSLLTLYASLVLNELTNEDQVIQRIYASHGQEEIR